MELSKRLLAVANEVRVKSVSDVGTDHAYIPIYLLQNKKIDFAVASDIKKGPLSKAEENVSAFKLSDKIKLRLAGGLDKTVAGETEGLIIAGMGGRLICDILKKEPEKTKSFKELILQPQLDIPLVRKTVHNMGFRIENEIFLNDMGKFYTVIKCVKGNEKYENEMFYEYGKILILKKDLLYKEFLSDKLEKYVNILMSLKEKHNTDTVCDNKDIKQVRILELEKEIKNLKEVISWL